MTSLRRQFGAEIDLGIVLQWLGDQVLCVVGERSRKVSGPAPINNAPGTSAITFCSRTGETARQLIAESQAGTIVCDSTLVSAFTGQTDKTLVCVAEPRLTFLRIVDRFFSRPRQSGVHPTAAIDPAAVIHPSVSIGAFSFIGVCEIGEGSSVGTHVHVADGTRIGRNVVIFPGTVLGADGFGYQRNEAGAFEKFPHIGGVVIEDDVEIGANACVDRGTLGDTIIRRGAKIDNLVHIAHNVVIGRHSAVIAHAMIGGSTSVGDGAWIAPCACVRDGLSIGKGATVGLGAVVVKDVADGETVMGSPAREASEYKRLLQRMRGL